MSAQVRLDAVIVAAGRFLTSLDIGFGYPLPGALRVVVIDVAVRTTSLPAARPADRCHFCHDQALNFIDTAWPGTPATRVEVTTRWPPYALPDSSPLHGALLDAAARAGLTPAEKVAGPSNIGTI